MKFSHKRQYRIKLTIPRSYHPQSFFFGGNQRLPFSVKAFVCDVAVPLFTFMPPPGIKENTELVSCGGTGDWFPAAEIRYYTNVYIVQDQKLLLGYKKRGFGIHK
jgi:hypothetical protein